jgi:hypothetical protein
MDRFSTPPKRSMKVGGPATAVATVTRADERCPYSNATRGNIDVRLTVDGAPLGVKVAETSSAN